MSKYYQKKTVYRGWKLIPGKRSPQPFVAMKSNLPMAGWKNVIFEGCVCYAYRLDNIDKKNKLASDLLQIPLSGTVAVIARRGFKSMVMEVTASLTDAEIDEYLSEYRYVARAHSLNGSWIRFDMKKRGAVRRFRKRDESIFPILFISG